MNGINAYLKRKMMFARIFGILTCLIAIAGIVLKYLAIIDEWLCIMSIAYCLGMIFTYNSNLQNVKVGNPWQRINSICAILMYILVVFIIVYGFTSGELVVQF